MKIKYVPGVFSVDINNTESVLHYIIECTLATLGDIACRKKYNKAETSRQLNIAQMGINEIIRLIKGGSEKSPDCRIKIVLHEFDGDVEKWYNDVRVTFK